MKVLTQRGKGGALLVVGAPLRDDIGIIVDLNAGEAFDKWNINSILLRGYWGVVTATSEEQDEAIKLARVKARKASVMPSVS